MNFGYSSNNDQAFERELHNGHEMLLIMNESSNINLRSIIDTADEHFHKMATTYPRFTSSTISSEFFRKEDNLSASDSATDHDSLSEFAYDVHKIHAMILQEYIGAINCIKERQMLAEADVLAVGVDDCKSPKIRKQQLENAITIYRSLKSSNHPIIRCSARYNVGVCLFNSGRVAEALQNFHDLEQHIQTSSTSQDSKETSLNSEKGFIYEDRKNLVDSEGGSTPQYTTYFQYHALTAIRSAIKFITKIEPNISVQSTNVNKPDSIAYEAPLMKTIRKSKTDTSLATVTTCFEAANNPPAQSRRDDTFSASTFNANSLRSSDAGHYAYSALKGRGPYPGDVKIDHREDYLSAEEFLRVFRMSREQFNTLAKWKQLRLKKDADLF